MVPCEICDERVSPAVRMYITNLPFVEFRNYTYRVKDTQDVCENGLPYAQLELVKHVRREYCVEIYIKWLKSDGERALHT